MFNLFGKIIEVFVGNEGTAKEPSPLTKKRTEPSLSDDWILVGGPNNSKKPFFAQQTSVSSTSPPFLPLEPEDLPNLFKLPEPPVPDTVQRTTVSSQIVKSILGKNHNVISEKEDLSIRISRAARRQNPRNTNSVIQMQSKNMDQRKPTQIIIFGRGKRNISHKRHS